MDCVPIPPARNSGSTRTLTSLMAYSSCRLTLLAMRRPLVRPVGGAWLALTGHRFVIVLHLLSPSLSLHTCLLSPLPFLSTHFPPSPAHTCLPSLSHDPEIQLEASKQSVTALEEQVRQQPMSASDAHDLLEAIREATMLVDKYRQRIKDGEATVGELQMQHNRLLHETQKLADWA